jgi:hypothetical protein
MPTAEAAAHAVFNGGGSPVRLFLAGAGTRHRARISVAPRSETPGESDFGKCGAGSVRGLPCRSRSGSLGLTIRSSGRPNRFAFGPPLSSRVRRLVLRWSEASPISASRDSSPRDVRLARAVLVRVASPIGRKVAGVSSSQARAPKHRLPGCLSVLAAAHSA